jgi:hypothetical protein
MSTPDHPVRTRRWQTPLTGVVIGLGYLVAGVIGDNLDVGLFGLLLMVFISIGFVVTGRRSETVAGLMHRRDERINAIDAKATQVAGLTLIFLVLAGFMVELARGRDGMPFSGMGAAAGVAYVATLLWGRFRG